MIGDKKKVHPSLGPKAMSGAQSLVLEYLEKINPQGRLLDMPAGQGYLSERARKMGFDVQCCDIDPDLFRVNDIACKKVNLNRDRLPFESSSFDLVVSVGGLHRLYNPKNAIVESWRVLIPEGFLIIGLKNYSSLRRRLLFLLYGLQGRNIITQSCHQTIEDPEANFRFPITALHLFNILQNVGFSVKEIKIDRISGKALMLFPLVLVIKTLGTLKSSHFSRKMNMAFSDPLPVLLGKNYMLLVSQKL